MFEFELGIKETAIVMAILIVDLGHKKLSPLIKSFQNNLKLNK